MENPRPFPTTAQELKEQFDSGELTITLNGVRIDPAHVQCDVTTSNIVTFFAKRVD